MSDFGPMLMTELFGVRIVEQHRFNFLLITHIELRLIIYQHHRRLLIKSDKDFVLKHQLIKGSPSPSWPLYCPGVLETPKSRIQHFLL